MKFAFIEHLGKKIPSVYFEKKEAYYCLNDLKLSENNFLSLKDFIERHTEDDIEIIARLEQEDFNSINAHYKHSDVKILSPITKPPHDILCVGLNYKDHVGEVKKGISKDFEMPTNPVFFSKRAENIIGANEKIECGKYTKALDYEVELAVVIGKKAKDISKENAESVIFGYSIFNDISARDLQKLHAQWFKGKSLDTASAMGPYIAHKSSLPLPFSLDVKSIVNGEVRQNSNTKHFIFDIPRIIEDLSYGMTLFPCDIISTGTPSGVGMGFEPPRLLNKGDTVKCSIEKIGTLENTVV